MTDDGASASTYKSEVRYKEKNGIDNDYAPGEGAPSEGRTAGFKALQTFLTDYAAIISIVLSALTFCFTQSYDFWRTRIQLSHLKVLNFEYPGEFVFTNVGGGDIVLDSVVLTWSSGPDKKNPLVLSINQVVKPSDVQIFPIKPQYIEPGQIGTAEWVHGKLDINTVNDAFSISNPTRCSVFHVHDAKKPSFNILNQEPGGPLMSLPTKAVITFIHPSNLFGPSEQTAEMDDAQTAFLKIPNCKITSLASHRIINEAPVTER